MNKINFSNGTDPGVIEVLSPFSGQLARVRRNPGAVSRKSIALFPRSEALLMRVPQLGYSLENLAFAICGTASLAVLLITVLGVN